MKKIKQRIVSNIMGDCFAACMASLLELPIEVLPNDHSEAWFSVWEVFLKQFGLEITSDSAKGAIWAIHPWIASVKSQNFENDTHAIIMHNGGIVLFDPSTKKTYKKGMSMLSKDIVIGGYRIEVSDFSKLHKLKQYRDKLSQERGQLTSHKLQKATSNI